MKNKLGKKLLAKKLLALILSTSLLFSVASSLPVFAATEVYGILTTTTTTTDGITTTISKIYNCDSKGENRGTTEIENPYVTNLFIASDVEIIPAFPLKAPYANLVSLTIPPTVRIIEGSFGVSAKLENIDFSNATGLEEIKGPAFSRCSSLKTVDLSKAINLRKFEIDSGDTYSTFEQCSNLEKVILPKNLEMIEKMTFVACDNLADVTFLSKNPPIVKEKAFANTKYQINFHLPAGSNVNEWKSAFWESNANNPVFIVNNKYGIYKNDGNVYECDENAVATATIADKKALSHLFIANDVTAIKSKDFFECGNLIEVNFSNTTNLTSIGDNAFAGCENLETIKIPDTVTSIGEFAFANCKSLNAVTLPKDITKIENSTFKECNKLERIEIPQNVTEINDFAFYNCQKLSSVSFQSTLPPTFGTTPFASTKDGINVFLNDTANENDWREKLIAAGMTNPKFAKDETPPTAEIKVGDAVFNSAITDITFKTLLKDNQKITITANDTDSAISKIEYQNVETAGDFDANGLWKTYTNAFEAEHLGANIIYARATDLAGNQTIINSNGLIVYTDSQLQTELTEFDRKEENQRDLFVRIILNGNTLKSITNGETVLEEGIDYIIEQISPQSNFADYPESSSLILHIKKSYLAKLQCGIQTLNFNFNPYAVEGSLVINTPLEITIKDTGHIHEYDTEFTIDKAATCTEEGEKSKHCKDYALCAGRTEITEIELLPHTTVEEWKHDDNEHWKFCTKCNQKTNVATHTWTTAQSNLGGVLTWGIRENIFTKLLANSNSGQPTVIDYTCTICGATKKEELKLQGTNIPMTTGDNSVYTAGTKDGATFVSVGNIHDYLGTSINGIPIKLSDIKVKAGSTIVTISSEYMDTLPNGQHTVSIYSTTGTATAKFTVVGNKETPTTPETPTIPTTPENPTTPTNPTSPNTENPNAEKPTNPETPTSPTNPTNPNAETPTNPTNPNTEKPTTPEIPKTSNGETMPRWIGLMFVSSGALMILEIGKKRRKLDEK